MRGEMSIRLLAILSVGLAGCASHYSGHVVDVHGRAVPHAHVEGHGMHQRLVASIEPAVCGCDTMRANQTIKPLSCLGIFPTRDDGALQLRPARQGGRQRQFIG
jgi:hypothetical protein